MREKYISVTSHPQSTYRGRVEIGVVYLTFSAGSHTTSESGYFHSVCTYSVVVPVYVLLVRGGEGGHNYICTVETSLDRGVYRVRHHPPLFHFCLADSFGSFPRLSRIGLGFYFALCHRISIVDSTHRTDTYV
jgi:hypothetical protein